MGKSYFTRNLIRYKVGIILNNVTRTKLTIFVINLSAYLSENM